jgi:hypothetical protein
MNQADRSAFEELIEAAARLGVMVRHIHLGGGGGGLAQVKGKRVLFIDLDAHPQDQLEKTAGALAGLAEIETVYLRPDVRDLLRRFQ